MGCFYGGKVMSKGMLRYFSHAFELDLSRLPAKSSDRAGLRIVLPGIVLGLFLAGLGIYEWLIRNYLKTAAEITDKFPNYGYGIRTFINPTVFDAIIILIGIGIVIALLGAYIKYSRLLPAHGQNYPVNVRVAARKAHQPPAGP